MPSTTVAAVQDLRNDLIIKPTVGAAILADYGTPGIDALFAVDGTLNVLPTGWFSCGATDTGGLQFNRALTVQDTMIWQSVLPARSDITADKRTVQVKFMEALKRPVVALDLSLTIAATPTTGATFKVDTDASGNEPYRRLICVGYDPAIDVIVAREYFKVKVNTHGNQMWDRSNPTMVDVTFDTYIDPVWGTSERRYIGGAGWATLAPAPAWTATTAYTLNAPVTLTTGSGGVVKATAAGTSGSTQPVLPATVGGTVTDGTVTWTRQS